MAQSDRDRYSTLEVWNVDPQDKISVPGNRTATPLTPDGRNGPGYTQEPATDAIGQQRRRCGLSPKAFWAAVVVLILVILGAIAGGVAGGLANQKSEPSFEDTTAPKDETQSPSQMAAVYHHNSTDNIRDFRAVFYHKNGSIYMRWKDKSRSPSWTEQNIESQFSLPDGEPDTLDVAKDSPLAVVIAPSEQGGRLHLFYIDTGRHIREIQRAVTDSKWVPGILWKPGGISTPVISGLAAIGHYCSSPRCRNETLLVYHRTGGMIFSIWATSSFETERLTEGKTASSLAIFAAAPINGTKLTEARLYYHSGEGGESHVKEHVFNQDGNFGWASGKQRVMYDLQSSGMFPMFSASRYASGSRGLVLALDSSSGRLTATWIPKTGLWGNKEDTQHQNLPANFRNVDATETSENHEEKISGIAMDEDVSLYARSGIDSQIRRYEWARETPNEFTFMELVGG